MESLAIMKWFRLYNETIHDRKLRRLPPAQRWLWIAILCAASDSPERGRLLLSDGEPVTVDDLADMAALPVKTVRDGLVALERLGMIQRDTNTIVVAKWADRQHKSDNSTERWRKWKSQQAESVEPTLGPTLVKRKTNVGQTAPPTATDTDTEVTPNGVTYAPQKTRPRDLLFEAIAEAWRGEPYRDDLLTETQAGLVGKATASLRKIGALPEEVPREWARIRGMYDNPTPGALEKHWGANGTGPAGDTRRPQTAEEMYRIAE